mgnify:FL=1
MLNTFTTTKAPIFAISRHRMGIDGPGITTLVTFMGCPLRCEYCPNKRCHEPIYKEDGESIRRGVRMLSPKELFDIVKIDDIYFQATGGGICFGGGEPTLYPEFIREFRAICGDRWKITLETCLVSSFAVKKSLCNVVDFWIADIKSIQSTIFHRYTKTQYSPMQMLSSLKKLIPQERVIVKVPIIPNYNTEESVDYDIAKIKQRFGFEHVVKVRYQIIK